MPSLRRDTEHRRQLRTKLLSLWRALSVTEPAQEFLGAAVADGEVRFFSPTSLDRGDPRAGGCPLKWWFRYVRRIKEADTASKDAGRKLHDELARYQKTGDRSLSALAMSGLHMVPTGPDLIVEQPIHKVTGKTIESLLHADGVPVIGFVDHCNRRGVNMGGDDVTATQDPPGTVEIIDWKWKRDGSKSEYYLTPDQLVLDTQLSGYGLGIGRHFGASHVRLGHGYFPSTRGRPRKVTKLHVLQDCADNWKYVDGLARHLRGIARESNPERIEGNKAACGSYGGCPYRDQCPTYKQDSLTSIFGETASQEMKMGITFGQQPAPAAPAQMPAAAPTQDALAAEEARLRAQAAQQQVMPGFVEACARLQASGRGCPPLGGAAAQMYAAAGGQAVAPGTMFAGIGALGQMQPITEPAHVMQLANEIAPQQAPSQPAPAPIAPQPVAIPWQGLPASAPPPSSPQAVQHVLPPDAPASQPHLAAKPVEGFPMPGAPVMPSIPFTFPPAQQPQGPTVAPLPPSSAPVPAAPSPSGATASPAAPALSPEPKKRARPKVAAAPVHGAQGVVATTEAATDGTAPVMQVFVDCTPNVESESLHPYVDGIVAELVSRFCAPPALPDVRCAPKDGPLGYGGWKGALRAIVLEKPPTAGTYHLRARGDEIVEEVAAAMLTVCNKTGGLYVR